MLLDMRNAPPSHEEGVGALWRKAAPEPRVSYAELFCSPGYVLRAQTLSIPHLVVPHISPTTFLPYLCQLRGDSHVTGFFTDSEWHGLHLPTSCQPPKRQPVFCSPCINICPSASSLSCIAILGGETTSVTLPHRILLHWALPMVLTQDISSVLHCCGKIPDITQRREGLFAASLVAARA